jgi:replication-associated recombination protein RarA
MSNPELRKNQSLAEHLHPETLGTVICQQQLLGAGVALSLAFEAGKA